MSSQYPPLLHCEVNIAIGDKLTIITGTHVLVCTVTQVRSRNHQGQPTKTSSLPTEATGLSSLPTEAAILIEIEVQDGIIRSSP